MNNVISMSGAKANACIDKVNKLFVDLAYAKGARDVSLGAVNNGYCEITQHKEHRAYERAVRNNGPKL